MMRYLESKFGPRFLKLFGVVSFILYSNALSAQGTSLKELKVSDVIPDIKIDNVVNYKSSSISLSDFEGKLIILDFWATWCSPCIAAFPKLDSLQNRFKDQIRILPVTDEGKSKVSDFLNKMYVATKLLPISVTEDKVLKRMFKHSFLPHYVWIDGNRRVIAITEGKDVNAENIEKVLKGEDVVLTYKKDIITTLSKPSGSKLYTGPGVFHKNTVNKNLEFSSMDRSPDMVYSLLTGYIDGIIPSGGLSVTELSFRNTTIRSLYMAAFGRDIIRMFNRTLVDVEILDSVLYEKITGTGFHTREPIAKGAAALAWSKANTYSYELRVPDWLASEKYSIMLNDLNRYFGAMYNVEGVQEKRNVTYLALIRTSDDSLFVSKEGEKKLEATKFSVNIRNGRMSRLVAELSIAMQNQPPIIDETGYKGNVDIQINCRLSDLEAVNQELSKLGLQLEKRQKLMDKTVIRMKTNKN